MASYRTTPEGRDFSDALRTQLVGRSQTEFGATVADCEGRSAPYSQSQVSDWMNGKEPSPSQVFAIEEALRLRPGTLSRILGYLPVSARNITSVPDALAADPALDVESRNALLASYRVLSRRKK